MAAIRERLGQIVGSEQLIKAALDALLAGVESPTLAHLAGLGRSEEPEAHDLFHRVIDELAPRLPDESNRRALGTRPLVMPDHRRGEAAARGRRSADLD